MGTQAVSKQHIMRMLDELPPESLPEVERYLDFLRLRQPPESGQLHVALGGLLEGYRFTEEEITRARRDMWSRLDNNPSWMRT